MNEIKRMLQSHKLSCESRQGEYPCTCGRDAAESELTAMQARIEKLEKLLGRIDVAFRTDTTQAEGNDYFWTVRQQLTDALKEIK